MPPPRLAGAMEEAEEARHSLPPPLKTIMEPARPAGQASAPTFQAEEQKCCAKKKVFCLICRGCVHTCRCGGRVPAAKRRRGQRGKNVSTIVKTSPSSATLPEPNYSSKYVDRANSDASSDEETASRLEQKRPEELAAKYLKMAKAKRVPVKDWRSRTCRKEWSNVIHPLLNCLASGYGTTASTLLSKMYKEVPGARCHLASRDEEKETAQSVGESVIDALRVAPSQKLRDELLPFVVSADGSDFASLKAIFPWLTEWHYRQARKKVMSKTSGEPVDDKGLIE